MFLRQQYKKNIFPFEDEMGLLDALKSCIRKFDFFRTSEYLRYKSQPEYKTLFGGILSLLIIIVLIVTFSNKIIDTFQKVIITSDSTNINAADPIAFNISTFPEDKFMFGVQIWNHDLNSGNRYFDVVLTNMEYDTGQPRQSSQKYPLEPCTLEHWEALSEVQKDFDRLKMNYWLCLPKNMKYNIQGKYASVFSQTLEVTVQKCTDQFNPSRPCASQAQIDDFFEQQGQVYFTIYFINPLINANNQKYLTYYLEDNNYIIFTKDLGAQGILFTEEYSITTDESILPFSEQHQEKGGIVTEFALKNLLSSQNGVYCSFLFFKSGITTIYTRKFQKLDQVLSYMGGLFGTITACLFFVKIYNETAFQIMLGFSLFQLKDQNQQKILKSYNFLTFLLAGFHKILEFFGWSPNWKDLKVRQQTGEQMTKQLDVLYLLKRVIFLQKAINTLMDQHQIKGIYFQKKPTLEEAKNQRKCFKAKKCIFKVNQSMKKMVKIEQPTIKLGQQSNYPPETIVHSQIGSSLNDNIVQRVIPKRNFPFSQPSLAVRKKSRKLTLKNLPYYEDDGSSSDSQPSVSEDILTKIYQLKIQAQDGHSVSKKIWSRFSRDLKKKITQILPRQDSSESDYQYEKEILSIQKVEENTQNEMTESKLYQDSGKTHHPIKLKFKRRNASIFPPQNNNFQSLSRISIQNGDLKGKTEFSLNEKNEFQPKETKKGKRKHQMIYNLD